MFQQGLLGWRVPRPNDFNSSDLKPLRDLFGDLQKFMTWPHVGFTVTAQAVTTGLTAKTITAAEDPYQLIRANSTIQVPRDFDRWMFLGLVGTLTDNEPGRHILAWFHNGVQINDWMTEQHFTGVNDHRMLCPIIMPVRLGDTLSVAQLAPAATTIEEGHGWGFFLPMG